MKIITVPEKAVIKDDKGVELPPDRVETSFKKFLVAHIDAYGEAKTVSQLRQAAKIIDKIESGNGTIHLEDEQYKLVKSACEKIIHHPFIARQFIAYYEAVEKATDQ